MLARSHGATVTTTLSWLAEYDSLHRAAIVQNVIRPNIGCCAPITFRFCLEATCSGKLPLAKLTSLLR